MPRFIIVTRDNDSVLSDVTSKSELTALKSLTGVSHLFSINSRESVRGDYLVWKAYSTAPSDFASMDPSTLQLSLLLHADVAGYWRAA